MRFSRQENWSGLPIPPPGYLPDPGIKLTSPALQVGSLPPESPGRPGKPPVNQLYSNNNKLKSLPTHQRMEGKSQCGVLPGGFLCHSPAHPVLHVSLCLHRLAFIRGVSFSSFSIWNACPFPCRVHQTITSFVRPSTAPGRITSLWRLYDQGLPVDGEPGCLHRLPLQGTTPAKDAFSSSRLPSCAWHRVDRPCIAETLHGQMLQGRLSKIKIHEFLCSRRVYIASSAIS